jgi:DNA segregation ATPase FtsK/SpoIIIE-like protein
MRQQGQGKSQQQQNRQIELNKVFGNNDFQGRTQQQQQEVLKQIPHQSNLIITSSTNDSRMLQPQQPSSSKPLSFNMR